MTPSDFSVQVHVLNDGTGSLTWERQTVDLDTLERAISLASDDALIGHNLRRLSVEVAASDMAARIALHKAGFRREGRLRERIANPDGSYEDVHLYSRLASDIVTGPVAFSSVMDSVLPTKRVIAHALFQNTSGEVLLLETAYKSDWELPGGVVDPGETPRVGAEREIREELGIDVTLGQPALVDWMPPYLGWSDAIEFLFVGGIIEDDVAQHLIVTDLELKALHWVSPKDVHQHVTELSARRIAKLVDGTTGYTEAGH